MARFCPRCGALSAPLDALQAIAAPSVAERPVRSGPPRWAVLVAAMAVLVAGGSATLALQDDGDRSAEVVASPDDRASLGTVRWQAPLHVQGWWWAPTAAAAGTVVVSQGGALHGVDPSSGELRWRRAFEASPWRGPAQPVVAGDHVLLGQDRGDGGFVVRSVDPLTGRDRWVLEEESGSAGIRPAEHSAYLHVWRPNPDAPHEPGTVELARLDPATGKVGWRRSVESGWSGAANDDVIVQIGDTHETRPGGEIESIAFEAIVLDGRTGDELWRRSLGGIHPEGEPAKRHPLVAVGGDRVILADVTGTLSAHDATTGAQVWAAAPAGRDDLGVVDDLVLVRDDRGHVVAHDLGTGVPRWQSEDRFVASVPLGAVGAGLLLVPYGGRRLTAVDLRDGSTRWVADVPAGHGGTVVGETFVTMSDPSGSGASPGIPELHAFDLSSGEPRWSLSLPFRAGLDVIGGRGWLATVETGRSLFVRDAATGDTRPFPSVKGTVTSASAGPEGEVITVSYDNDGRQILSSVDPAQVRWEVRTRRAERFPWTPLVGPVATRTLAVVAEGAALLAYDLANGHVVARTRMADEVTGLVGTPGGLLVTIADGAVALVPADGGEPDWTLALPAAVVAAGAVGDGTAYAGAEVGEVVAIDLESGRVRWRRDLGGPLSEPPVVAADHVIAVVGQTLVALDPESGEPRWRQDFSSPLAGPPVALGEELRVALTDGTVLALDRETGGTTSQLILGDSVAAGPWVVGDGLYVATAASRLVAIGPLPEAAATVSPPPILDRP